MPSFLQFVLIVTLVVGSSEKFASAQEVSKPLTSSQVLALVAGRSLPETIVQQIRSRGLAVKCADCFRILLIEVGADGKVLALMFLALDERQNTTL